MEYQLRRSKRRRSVEIQVRPEGVRVLAPEYLAQSWIDEFVLSRRQWIIRKQAELQRRLSLIEEQHPQQAFGRGTEILYRHQKLSLALQFDADQSQVQLSDGLLNVAVSRRIRKPPEQAARGLVETWLRQQAQALFAERVAFWASRMTLFPASIKVKSFRRKWGCCDSKAEVRFNWLLIMAPDTVIDYVIIHELAHLQHMNHSAAFWSLVSRFCPEYKTHQRWLDQHGASLYLP